MADILVLFHSRYGSVRKMAEYIAQGIENVPPCKARIRTVLEINEQNVEKKYPIVAIHDFLDCWGMALGSPTRFGNMSAPLKACLDNTSSLWLSGGLAGKPAIVFTSTSSLHGGQESTLLSMMLPLLHHGMILLGIPSTQKELLTTKSGGTPYGATHHSGNDSQTPFTTEEKVLCIAQGKRLAEIAKKLHTKTKDD